MITTKFVGLDVGASTTKGLVEGGKPVIQATAMARSKAATAGRRGQEEILFGNRAVASGNEFHVDGIITILDKGVHGQGGVSAEVRVNGPALRSFLEFMKAELGFDPRDFNIHALLALPHTCFKWDETNKCYQPMPVAETVRDIASQVFGNASVYSEILASLVALQHDQGLNQRVVVDIGHATVQIALFLDEVPREGEISTSFGAVGQTIDQAHQDIAMLLGGDGSLTRNEAAEIFRLKATRQHGATVEHDFGVGPISEVLDVGPQLQNPCYDLAATVASRLDALVATLPRPIRNTFVQQGVLEKVLLIGGGSQIDGIADAVQEAIYGLQSSSFLRQSVKAVEVINADAYSTLIARGVLLLKGRNLEETRPTAKPVPPVPSPAGKAPKAKAKAKAKGHRSNVDPAVSPADGDRT